MSETRIVIKRALLSCWDKEGLPELASALSTAGVELISSGGTAGFLQKHGVAVSSVESITGFGDLLGGRVKTLHPLIYAPLLARASADDQAELQAIGAAPLQLVVVNLYPFVEEALQKKLPVSGAVEYIDIGGPSLLRAAAKNHENAVALFDKDQYPQFLRHFQENGGAVTREYAAEQARKTFFYTSWYDARIASYLAAATSEAPDVPDYYPVHLVKSSELRYGENPHQKAAVYQPFHAPDSGMATLRQLSGKELSFNNYVDVDAAFSLVREFQRPAVAIIKHCNPCGAAVSDAGVAPAFEAALKGDPQSAFGGIVAVNRPVQREAAELMSKIFLECIIAPAFDDDALGVLSRKKNLRLLQADPSQFGDDQWQLRSLHGAYLVQQEDQDSDDPRQWQCVTRSTPNDAQREDLQFAWTVAKHVKSNAIVLARDLQIYGVGAGQMSRVDSVTIARMKAQQAGRTLSGLVLASDAFFPFRDGIDQAHQAGVTAIIQPGGSVRDAETIAAADEHAISMLFTGTRHFKH